MITFDQLMTIFGVAGFASGIMILFIYLLIKKK